MDSEFVNKLGKETFESLKSKLSDSFDSLTQEQKDALKRVTAAYAKLTAEGFVRDVDARELAAAKAAMRNFEVAATLEVRSALVDTMETVLSTLVTVARKLVLG